MDSTLRQSRGYVFAQDVVQQVADQLRVARHSYIVLDSEDYNLRMDRVCAMVNSVRLSPESELYVTIKLLDTPHGHILTSLIDQLGIDWMSVIPAGRGYVDPKEEIVRGFAFSHLNLIKIKAYA